MEEKQRSLQDAGDDASAQRKARGALYAEEVKVGHAVLGPLHDPADARVVISATRYATNWSSRISCGNVHLTVRNPALPWLTTTMNTDRSCTAFRARCRYFEPPPSDTEARKWWDSV